MSRRATQVAAALALLMVAGVLSTILRAQQDGQESEAPRYRRIFVPEDELQSHVKGLLPVKREEFQRRLATRRETAPSASKGPRISRGYYTARLKGQDLVDGVARLEIAASPGDAGSLSWEGSNLAFGQGTWDEQPPRRATLGIGARDGLILRVDKPGVVSFPWSRRGNAVEKGALEFELELPPASLHELRLQLPSHLRLTAEQGLVSRTEPATAGTGEVEWRVELGGIRQATLRVMPAAAADRGTDLMLLRESARYALTPLDVSAEFQFQLELNDQPLGNAQLQVDPRLQVTGVSVRTLPIAWAVAAGETSNVLSIEFPESLADGNHTVSVQAVSKLAASQPWRLPRIVWQGAVWQEGSATVHVPPDLQVAVTAAQACRATVGVPLAAGGESLAFQYHAADGYVEIEAAPRRARLAAAVGVTAQFDSTTQISATLRADVTSQDGETFEVDAVISKEWTLDSLETEPPDLLEDRPVVSQDERTRTMRLKFLRPVTPRSPVRLVVHARRQQAHATELSSNALWRWFRLRGVLERPTVLALRNSIANYDLQVAGDIDAQRLDPEASAAEELSLIDAPAAGLLFRLHPDASDFRVLLREGDPRYTATWDVTAACSRTRIRQEVIVRCVPSGPGVSRLTLRSAPPPDREIRWRVTGNSDATVVAQTRRDVSASAEQGAAEATWELELSRPLGQPFALEATWETPRQASHPIALFSCQEATSQSCQVRLTAEDDARWLTSASGLTAVPIVADAEFTSTRGLYRYEPGQRLSLSVNDASHSELAPLARIERAELTTRFAADGSALGALSLTIANTGLAYLPLALPAGAMLQEVSVNGRAVDPLRAGLQPGDLRIPLPPGERHAHVRVSYAAAAQQRPLYVQTWRTELPSLSLPAPPLVWQVVLPPGIRKVVAVRDVAWEERLWARFWGPFVDSQPWTRWLHPWREELPAAAGNVLSGSLGQNGAPHSTSASAASGWVVFSEQHLWSQSLAVEICEQHRFALFSLALALLSAGLVLAAPRRWLSGWWLWSAVLAAGLMLVPMALVPPLAGAFWGVLAGCTATLLRPAPAGLRRDSPSPVSTARWVASAGVLLIGLMTWLLAGNPAALNAQPPPAGGENDHDRAPAQRVVIPMDEDRQPVGDYVFVEDKFYDWLFARPQSGQLGGAWQVTGANYDVRWPDSQATGTPAAELRASLEIETFAADVPLTLPFHRQDLLLRQGGARLDGVPLAVSWQEDGRGLSATIPAAGRYRLELVFSAPLKDADRQELSVAIPRVPHAAARISNLTGTDPPESTTALGSLRAVPDVAAAVWQLDLGAVSRLSLRAANEESNSDRQTIEAEQLLWWKVRPGSVVVDAVCRFHSLDGPLREVQVRFDPRLRLLPLADLPPGATFRVENAAANTLHVSLAEASPEFVVRPRFLLSQSSGIGKIVPPRIEPVAGRISRQWMAVTVTPGLELIAPEQPLINVAPSDFAKAAGVVDVLPQVAFELVGAASMPELDFRPETRRAFATSATTVYCGLQSCRLQFEAEFTGLATQHVQQRVGLPPGWTATHVAVRDGDLPVPSRWFQQDDGHVIVRLNQPPGSSQQLEIHAAMTPTAGTPLTLSVPQPLEVDDGGHLLTVLRGYECDVQLSTENTDWTDDGAMKVGRVQDGLNRLVAGLRAPAGAQRRQLTLTIVPNRPEVSARLVTRYAETDSAGSDVTLLCDLDIRNGRLDVLRLEVPPEWSGPWQTSPPLSIEVKVLPGQKRRVVELVPDLPFSGKVQVTLQAPLRQAAGEPLGVPDVTLMDVSQLERLVQIPKTAKGSAASWRVGGLQAASLTPDLRTGPWSEGVYETLAVVAPQFEAIQSLGAAAKREPLVWLAQYEARWQPSGIVQGEADFDLDSTGLASCLVQFPPGCRPTFALLDGLPADLIKDRADVWRLPFVGERLPQRLTVGFLGSARPAAGKLKLEGPTLVGLPAKATIWSLLAPPSLASGTSKLQEEEEIVQLEQDLLRLQATAELLERGIQRDLTGLSSESLANWVRPWRQESAATSQRVRSALHALVGNEGDSQEAFRTVEAKLDRLWSTLPAGSSAENISVIDAARPGDEHDRRLGAALQSHQPQVSLSLVGRSPHERGGRAAVAGMLLLGAVAAWLLCRWTAVQEWLAVSGPFLVVLGSIALACLSPLGLAALVLALIGLMIAWRSPWSRQANQERSAILHAARRRSAAT